LTPVLVFDVARNESEGFKQHTLAQPDPASGSSGSRRSSSR
jgi:hypothetical protein